MSTIMSMSRDRSASLNTPEEPPHDRGATKAAVTAAKVQSRCDLDLDPTKLSPWRQEDDVEVYRRRHVLTNSGSIVLRRPATSTRPALAVKKPLRASMRDQNREVWIEHQMLVYLQGDPAVVQPYRVCVRDPNSGDFWLETKWVDGVTLEQALARGHAFSEDAARPLITSLIRAMLRWQKVLNLAHRDIKPANIIVHDDRSRNTKPESVRQDQVVVIDFASASLIDRCRDVQGSHGWRAPELENLSDGQTYDPFKSEVWSVGHLLQTMTALPASSHPNSGPSESLRDLLVHMKKPDPDARIALGEVLSHRWFTGQRQPAPLSPSSCRAEQASPSPSSGHHLSARA